jgi:hypothetical protein
MDDPFSALSAEVETGPAKESDRTENQSNALILSEREMLWRIVAPVSRAAATC